MRQEFEKNYHGELPIVNNTPEELSKVSLPDNWWSSQNSYEIFSEKNVKIVDLNRVKNSNRSEIDYPGWEVEDGDFIGEFGSEKRILTKRQRETVEKLELFGFVLLAAGVIILISYGIAETIRW